eukprot:gene3407-2289_t
MSSDGEREEEGERIGLSRNAQGEWWGFLLNKKMKILNVEKDTIPRARWAPGRCIYVWPA